MYSNLSGCCPSCTINKADRLLYILGCCLSCTINKADRLLYILGCCPSCTINKADRLLYILGCCPSCTINKADRLLHILGCCPSCTISKADRLAVHRIFTISGCRLRPSERLLRELFTAPLQAGGAAGRNRRALLPMGHPDVLLPPIHLSMNFSPRSTISARAVTPTASTIWRNATDIPTAPDRRIDAAVVSPSTYSDLLRRKMVPAPRKLMPVIIASTMRIGSERIL